MKVTVTLRGVLQKKFPNVQDEIIDVPDGTTCEQALEKVGIYYKEVKNFGFVSVNNKRVMIHDELHEGDMLKAYSRISGG